MYARTYVRYVQFRFNRLTPATGVARCTRSSQIPAYTSRTNANHTNAPHVGPGCRCQQKVATVHTQAHKRKHKRTHAQRTDAQTHKQADKKHTDKLL